MELKSLFLGVIFAVVIFAFKGGIGLGYFLARRKHMATSILAVLLFAGVYFALFEAGYLLTRKVAFIVHLELIQAMLRYAMLIHTLLAGGLFFWGLCLLRGNSKGWQRSYGWAALVTPCPVCLSIIFIIIAILNSYFTDTSHMALLGAYLLFISIALATAVGVVALQAKSDIDYSKAMGITMMALASYFLLAVIIMPQFKDVDKIYRLAAHKAQGEKTQHGNLIVASILVVGAWLSGFLGMRAKIKRAVK